MLPLIPLPVSTGAATRSEDLIGYIQNRIFNNTLNDSAIEYIRRKLDEFARDNVPIDDRDARDLERLLSGRVQCDKPWLWPFQKKEVTKCKVIKKT